jgi:ligand-binding SRPBCC domain-containing protein
MSHFSCSAIVKGTPSEVFSVLSDAHVVPQLFKGDLKIEVVHAPEKVKVGSECSFKFERWGVKQPVRFQVTQYQKGFTLSYKQVQGLFHHWFHTIKIEPHGRDAVIVYDYVDYQLPMGLLGCLLDDVYFRSDLQGLMQRRLQVLQEKVAVKKKRTAQQPLSHSSSVTGLKS